jgi:GTP-binding protein Era
LSEEVFRSGWVALVGRPNVGKSTLINDFMGQKVVITSEKPQTTRNRILCVYSDPASQILFFDTPGVHKPRDEMNKYMVEQARESLAEADLTLLLVEFEPDLSIGRGDRFLLEMVQQAGVPFFVVLNKIDLGKRDQVHVFGLKWRELLGNEPLYPTSAVEGMGVPELLGDIKAAMPEGPAYFDEALLTDRSERFVVGELIREKIFRSTRQEIPYSTAVLVEEMKDRGRDNKLYVKATVFVEAESQKGVLIGKGGSMLKKIGKEARAEIERLVNCGVFLELRVKVHPHWRRDRKFIQKLEQPHL